MSRPCRRSSRPRRRTSRLRRVDELARRKRSCDTRCRMGPCDRPVTSAGFFMHILLLGSGGREHALAWKIAASPLVTKLWCAPGNAGIAREAECVALDIADHEAVIDFCRANAVELVVVGPETPLAAGIVDDLAAAGIKAFGPSKQAARLEGSKGFTKALCTRIRHSDRRLWPIYQCGRRAGLCPRQGRADRGQGRWSGGGQGRGGGDDLGRGQSRHRHDVRWRVRPGRRRGGDRGVSRPARRSASLRCPTARPRSRWPRRRTTSGCSTMTRGRTPAAWAPTRRPRSSLRTFMPGS